MSEKISALKIKEYLASLSESEQLEYLNLLAADKRKTIQNLVQKHQSFLTKKIVEKQRLLKMWDFEDSIYRQNYVNIAGVDEVGRGPLAGPVVAGAVILPPYCQIEGLNDSKKINERKRTIIAAEIKAKAIAWAVGTVGANIIDKLNILEATRYAMFLAVSSLGNKPDYVLLDGQENPLLTIPQSGIVKGDNLSASIAAASIIAKVYRDNIMDVYDKIYPGFGFALHKGYGTQQHLESIHINGVCPIHRKTFAPIKHQIG